LIRQVLRDGGRCHPLSLSACAACSICGKPGFVTRHIPRYGSRAASAPALYVLCRLRAARLIG
jgi:hypothetical protein